MLQPKATSKTATEIFNYVTAATILILPLKETEKA